MAGLLGRSDLGTGGYHAYSLLTQPWAVVFSTCLDEKSQDFFLVPLAHVTPFLPKSPCEGMDFKTVKTKMEVRFNQVYGHVAKGLFNILYAKQVFERNQDGTLW